MLGRDLRGIQGLHSHLQHSTGGAEWSPDPPTRMPPNASITAGIGLTLVEAIVPLGKYERLQGVETLNLEH
jgi:hypothetical protein